MTNAITAQGLDIPPHRYFIAARLVLGLSQASLAKTEIREHREANLTIRLCRQGRLYTAKVAAAAPHPAFMRLWNMGAFTASGVRFRPTQKTFNSDKPSKIRAEFASLVHMTSP
jgi:hypothetical protein